MKKEREKVKKKEGAEKTHHQHPAVGLERVRSKTRKLLLQGGKKPRSAVEGRERRGQGGYSAKSGPSMAEGTALPALTCEVAFLTPKRGIGHLAKEGREFKEGCRSIGTGAENEGGASSNYSFFGKGRTARGVATWKAGVSPKNRCVNEVGRGLEHLIFLQESRG